MGKSGGGPRRVPLEKRFAFLRAGHARGGDPLYVVAHLLVHLPRHGARNMWCWPASRRCSRPGCVSWSMSRMVPVLLRGWRYTGAVPRRSACRRMVLRGADAGRLDDLQFPRAADAAAGRGDVDLLLQADGDHGARRAAARRMGGLAALARHPGRLRRRADHHASGCRHAVHRACVSRCARCCRTAST